MAGNATKELRNKLIKRLSKNDGTIELRQTPSTGKPVVMDFKLLYIHEKYDTETFILNKMFVVCDHETCKNKDFDHKVSFGKFSG